MPDLARGKSSSAPQKFKCVLCRFYKLAVSDNPIHAGIKQMPMRPAEARVRVPILNRMYRVACLLVIS